MALPATKRRKLEQSDDESEGSFAEFGSDAAHDESGNSGVEDEGAESDVSMGAPLDDDVSDDEDDDVEEAASKAPAPAKAPAASNKPSANKRPAASLQDGAYTAETFKSNIFKLQVDELLEQVKPKHGKKAAAADNVMRTLKTIIEQIPAREALPIPDAEKALKTAGVAVPFPSPRPPKDAKYKLQYDRPAGINVTGSYPLKTATRSDDAMAMDLVVTMPKALFTDKDYLNHRYFYKRAYYLACLAAGIKQSKHKFDLAFDCWQGNHLQPILVIRPSGNGDEDDFTAAKCTINILIALPENTFAQNKLLPNSNCVRPKGTEDDASTKTLPPTPFYNSTLQSDANVTAYLKLLYATASKADAYKDACILGRIWLKQRGFGSRMRNGGFGNFEWAALVALLLQPNQTTGAQPLSPGYSSYQLFKATLQFLARNDLTKKPVVLQAHNITIPKGEHAPVFFDGPRGQNILFKMTSWSYSRLRLEAQATVDMLSEAVFDQFDSTFITKTEVLSYRYDATLEIPLSAFGLDPAGEDYDQQLTDVCQKLHKNLTRALTDRVTAISFTLPSEDDWSISARRPHEKQRKSILVNLVTDPTNANRTVDHGPAAENKQEAAAFRKFWGEKAELRRFKDGSILESVVWSLKDASASVIEQIVLFILKQHLGVESTDNVKFTSDAFAHLVSAGRIQGASGVAPYLPIMNAFSAMEKDIRDLEDLPLQLRSIRAADSQLRYSSVEVPAPGHPPASVVLQFEGSGRWPDDLCAIQRTKIAFLLRISDLLADAQSEYTSRVGLENSSQPAQNQAFLDVTTPAGFSFRIRIYHDREVTLFERQLKDKTLDAASRESAAGSLALYKREFVQSPQHSQVLQTLCTRFPALSPSIRLMKRWFAAHLLSPHFSPELIELLVIRTFLQPHPWPVPATASSGFLRTLAWIGRWDWRHVPLVVDFSSTFSANPAELETGPAKGMQPSDLERIQTRFEAWRRIDPAMNRVVLFAATNLDEEGTTWTDKAAPEKVVAARLTALAKAASGAVRADEDNTLARSNGIKASPSQEPLDPTSLFTPSLTDFDITLTIAPKYTLKSASKKRKSLATYKNLDLQATGPRATAATTPLVASFAEDLRAVYGDAVLWFWDPEALDVVVGLWNPVFTAQRAWKVRVGWNSEPVRVKGKVEGEKGVDVRLNKGAVVEEITRLGGELVAEIKVRE